MRVELHPEARLEIRSAALWYDERSPGQGARFLEQFTAIVSSLTTHPDMYPVWPGLANDLQIPKATMDTFPYLLAYEVHGSVVLIVAVAHGRRRPLYWVRRATEDE